MTKKISKKGKKKVIASLCALLVIGVIVVAILYSTGFFGPLSTVRPDIIDGRGPTVYTHTFSVTTGDTLIIAQKIRVPYNVVSIHLVDLSGVAGIDASGLSSKALGISAQKSDNPSDWLYSYSGFTGTSWQINTNAVHPYLGQTVTPGNDYYFMTKLTYRYSRTITISATNTYADGGIHICDNGLWSTELGNIKFTTQGYLTYGVDVEFLSVGAYPSTITVGQTATFKGTMVSSSGGTVEVFLLEKIGSTWTDLDSQVVDFSVGETKTVTFTWSGFSQGIHYMGLEVRMGGEEEAHGRFALTVTAGVNSPPSVPTLTGSSSLDVGVTGSWSARSTDPEGNNIMYTWTADGGVVRTSGYMSSGSSDSLTYAFSSAGSHTISVQARDQGGATSGWASKTVQVSQGVPGQYTATIYVKDSVTSAGISGASVTIGTQQGTTSQYGLVELQLPVGVHSISASATGYSPGTGSITVTTSGGSGTVYLTPIEVNGDGYVLTVSVFDDLTNGLLEGAMVSITGGDSQTTTSTGTLIFTLGPGTYTVSASKGGYTVDVKTVTITDAGVPVLFYLVPIGAPAVPGFEVMTLIAAVGLAGIILKRRKKNK